MLLLVLLAVVVGVVVGGGSGVVVLKMIVSVSMGLYESNMSVTKCCVVQKDGERNLKD